jgi:hypothetical protein
VARWIYNLITNSREVTGWLLITNRLQQWFKEVRKTSRFWLSHHPFAQLCVGQWNRKLPISGWYHIDVMCRQQHSSSLLESWMVSAVQLLLFCFFCRVFVGLGVVVLLLTIFTNRYSAVILSLSVTFSLMPDFVCVSVIWYSAAYTELQFLLFWASKWLVKMWSTHLYQSPS